MALSLTRINLAPSSRALASGLPVSAVNHALKGIQAGGHGSGHAADEHGHNGPRKDAIPSWVSRQSGSMHVSRAVREYILSEWQRAREGLVFFSSGARSISLSPLPILFERSEIVSLLLRLLIGTKSSPHSRSRASVFLEHQRGRDSLPTGVSPWSVGEDMSFLERSEIWPPNLLSSSVERDYIRSSLARNVGIDLDPSVGEEYNPSSARSLSFSESRAERRLHYLYSGLLYRAERGIHISFLLW
jgi:hypothetical protein